jgi:pilus assembly protein CpaC
MMSLQTEHARDRGQARRREWLRQAAVIAAILGAALISGELPGSATAAEVHDIEYARPLFLTVGKSRTLRMERPFVKAVVAAPDVADVLPISNQVLYIQAKKVGTTNVSLFDDKAHVVAIIDLAVNVDTASLQQQIRASTGSSGIRVSSSGNQIILSGLAADSVAADRAVAVAKGLAPEGVVNAMQVAPPQQVMLEVRFLEVVRDAGRHLGVNWIAATPGPNGVKRGVTTGRNETRIDNDVISPVVTNDAVGIPLLKTLSTLVSTVSPAAGFGTILANVLSTSNGTTIDLLVSTLETKGLVRRLAEPNLIALSGDAARFLAGGEFPVPVAATTLGGVPTITIEFKKFGVELAFVPTVLSRGVINLRVEPSVSELDFTNAVTVQGTTIPL